MSADIQQARDTLAKWRGHPMTGNWGITEIPLDKTFYSFDLVDDSDVYAANTDDEAAARLIVGTAGNPDLLDAIDNMLGWVVAFNHKYDVSREFGHYTATIAAAIIRADERMTS